MALTEKLHPDLILMDIEMPEMSGIEAARHIQNARPTPVVLVTAYDSMDLIREARDVGVAAYLVKPLDPHELERTVTIALARFEDWMALRQANEELAKRNEQLQNALAAIASGSRVSSSTKIGPSAAPRIRSRSVRRFPRRSAMRPANTLKMPTLALWMTIHNTQPVPPNCQRCRAIAW